MKDYLNWSKLLKEIDNKEVNLHFKEREIRWCYLGVNIGNEENGKNERFERPVLILKKINNELLWILPLTTKYKGESYKFCIGKIKEEYNYVLLDQIRTISAKRLRDKMTNF